MDIGDLYKCKISYLLNDDMGGQQADGCGLDSSKSVGAQDYLGDVSLLSLESSDSEDGFFWGYTGMGAPNLVLENRVAKLESGLQHYKNLLKKAVIEVQRYRSQDLDYFRFLQETNLVLMAKVYEVEVRNKCLATELESLRQRLSEVEACLSFK